MYLRVTKIQVKNIKELQMQKYILHKQESIEEFAKSIRISVILGLYLETFVKAKNEFMNFFLFFRCCLFLFLFSPFLLFRYPYLPLRPSSFFLSLFFSVTLRFAKVQRRGLPVVDDQRGFPFSTPCCAATTLPPFSSLPSSSLFFHASSSIRMIILYTKRFNMNCTSVFKVNGLGIERAIFSKAR